MSDLTGLALPEQTTFADQLAKLEARVAALEAAPAQDIEDRLALVLFSGDLDRAIAAFIIATGAAAVGMEVSVFFTFWGISLVKKERQLAGKSLLERGFAAALPAGPTQTGLSQMNFFGLGATVIRKLMRDREVASLEELIALARELGVRFTICEMSRELLGVRDGELIEGLEAGGVAAFLGDAARAKITLFI